MSTDFIATKQKELLKEYVDCSVCTAECLFCGYQQTKTIDELYENGWRIVVSKKYNEEGLTCPECMTKKDKDR